MSSPSSGPGARPATAPRVEPPDSDPGERKPKLFFSLDAKAATFDYHRQANGNKYTVSQVRGYLGAVWLIWDPGNNAVRETERIPPRFELRFELDEARTNAKNSDPAWLTPGFDGRPPKFIELGTIEIQIGAAVSFNSAAAQLYKVPAGAYIGIKLSKSENVTFCDIAIWDGGRWVHVWSDKYAGPDDDVQAKNKYHEGLVRAHPAFDKDRCKDKDRSGSHSGSSHSGADQQAAQGASREESEGRQPQREGPEAYGYQWRQWPETEAWQQERTDKQVDSLGDYLRDRGMNLSPQQALAIIGSALKLDTNRRSSRGHWRMTIEFVKECSDTAKNKFLASSEYDPFADE